MDMACTRRAVVAGAAATLALGTRGRAADVPAFPTQAIDVHHHFLPPFYKPLAKSWLDKFATGVPTTHESEAARFANCASHIAGTLASASSTGTPRPL